VAKGFFQYQGQDYDETFDTVESFESLRLLLCIIATNAFVAQQLDVKAAVLYGELKEAIYRRLPESYRDSNKVALLKRYIYGLKQSPRVWYSRLTTHLRKLVFDTSNFDPCVLWYKSDQLYIAGYVDDLTSYGPP
jgi:hypothetical protein